MLRPEITAALIIRFFLKRRSEENSKILTQPPIGQKSLKSDYFIVWTNNFFIQNQKTIWKAGGINKKQFNFKKIQFSK